MSKIVLFSLPLVSVHKAFCPIMDELCERGHTVVYFNKSNFAYKNEGVTNIAYPDKSFIYDTEQINGSTSFFAFSEILLDTTDAIFAFLQTEINKEQPQLIAHSHLSVWGKLVSNYFKIPAVCIYTTFSLNRDVMIPFFRQDMSRTKNYKNIGINAVLNLQRKYLKTFKKLNIKLRPDIWDSYTNEQAYNIFLINEALAQDTKQIKGVSYFVGYPLTKKYPVGHGKHIYVSMGTVFNDDNALFDAIINSLSQLEIKCIISIGKKVDMNTFKHLPDNIMISDFLDQELILSDALVFITRGGMASIHEALLYNIPTIVIPEIPEQQLTAIRIGELGLGMHLDSENLRDPDILKIAVEHMITNRPQFVENIKRINVNQVDIVSESRAADIIEDAISKIGILTDSTNVS